MIDNQTTELKSLSKLKKAGKLRYWRGTIEIPETELHAICDEIQEEYDRVVAALNATNNQYIQYIYGFDSGYNAGHEARNDEIVQCKDCRFAVAEGYGCGKSNEEYLDVEPNGFCAWGEREMMR